jgi:membrane associated rhomboid family serine protease
MKVSDIWNNMLLRIIAINVAVFVVVHIVVMMGVSQYAVSEHTALPANPVMGVTHIYTVLFYMFTQWQFTHLLFNMLWLWCFGSILLRYGESERIIASTYVIGGFAGAACFMIMGAMGLANGVLIGSSAAVMAVMAACGVILARHKVELMLFGTVEVRWLAAVVIAFTAVIDATAGGIAHIGPHLGGALAGVIYGITHMRRAARHGLKASEHDELNELLTKVKNSGYNALNSNEKSRLFLLSNKRK